MSATGRPIAPARAPYPTPIQVGTLDQMSLLQHCASLRLVTPVSSTTPASTHKRPALVTRNGRHVCRRQAQQPRHLRAMLYSSTVIMQNCVVIRSSGVL